MESIGNNFQNIGHIKTTKWKEAPKGENNDCYWNIAANSLDSDASSEEIARVMNEIIELNAQKDENGNYDTVLLADKEILMPVEQTIKQANEVIQETLSGNENTIDTLENLKDSLLNLQEEYKNASLDNESLEEYQKLLDSIDKKISLKNLEAVQLSAAEAAEAEAEAEEAIEAETEAAEVAKEETAPSKEPETQEEKPTEPTMQEQLRTLQTDWQETKDKQGIFGKAINGIKNLFKTQYSSNKINSEIETLLTRYEKGETLTQEELNKIQEKINTYKTKQHNLVEKTTTFGAIFTGGLAGIKAGSAAGAALGSAVPGAGTAAGAVVGGVCGFIAGAFTGAFAKTSLKQVEKMTDNIKGNSFKAQDIKHDALSGAKYGGLSGGTSGLSAGMRTFNQVKEFASTEAETITKYDVLDENGNVIASFNNEAGASNQANKAAAEIPHLVKKDSAQYTAFENTGALMLPENQNTINQLVQVANSGKNIENAQQLIEILPTPLIEQLSENTGLSIEECVAIIYEKLNTLSSNMQAG